MSDACKREFMIGQIIYAVDSKQTQPIVRKAQIIQISGSEKKLLAVFPYDMGDGTHIYSFSDYGRLYFFDKKEAMDAADKLPKPNTTLYEIVNAHVRKRVVYGLWSNHFSGDFDLYIRFKNKKSISTKELNVTLFFDKKTAKQNIH